MVKVNFKTTPPILDLSGQDTSEGKAPAATPTDILEKREDFTPESAESFFDKSEIEAPPREPVAPAPEPEAAPPAYDFSLTDEPDFHDEGASKKKWFIIIGAALLALIIIVGAFFYFSGEEQPQAMVEEPASVTTQPPATPVTEQPASVLQPIYAQNAASNKYLHSQLEGVLNWEGGASKYSLVVITPSEINLTILADSRDAVARHAIDLKKTFSGLAFRIISVQSKFSDGKEMIYADLRAPLVPAKPAGAPGGVAAQEVGNLEGMFRSLAKRFKVKVQYFKQGKSLNHTEYVETFYYANASGKKENILKLMNELAGAYPMLRINKFSIFPYNLGTISGKTLSTRMNFSICSSK